MEKYDITDCLKDDKELQKAVIDEFLKEIAELKAENERLRTCLDTQRIDGTNQYIKKVNVERKNYKLKQTLQEIKEIAEFHITDADSEDVQNDMKQIIDLIIQAEVE